MVREQLSLYEQLRVLREGEGQAAALVERAFAEISRLEASGKLEPDTASRWRDAFAAESEASAPVPGSGIHLGTGRFGPNG